MKHTSNHRRQFLARVGRAAGVGSLLRITGPATTGAALHAAIAEAAQVAPHSLALRVARAYEIRHEAALANSAFVPPAHASNGDDERYADRLASYSKCLPHDGEGRVDPRAYDGLLTALRTGRPEDYERLVVAGPVRLGNPQSALSFDLIGLDAHQYVIPPAPALGSARAVAEMIELYWRALTRDVPFSRYASDPLVNAAAAELGALPGYEGPRVNGRATPDYVFRSLLPGDTVGPFVSQFLYKPVVAGAQTIDQRIRVPVAGDDHLTSESEWLHTQNGGAAPRAVRLDSTPRYIRNGRDLAEWVHRDVTYQGPLHAALILLTSGTRVNEGNPYRQSLTQAGFVTFGMPHVVDMIGKVACLALKAVWFQKWHVHRRLRPEEQAGRIWRAGGAMRRSPGETMASAEILRRYGTLLLPMAYPEGCPPFPAYPGGHAAIAAAGVTILKAFFDETAPIADPVVPSDDGLSLVPYNGPALTVGGELNKLASNIGLGRDTAGVHYRSDEHASFALGEAVAIAALQDSRRCFNEDFRGLTFTRFDGTRVTV